MKAENTKNKKTINNIIPALIEKFTNEFIVF